jgi:hypothetical protein
MADPTRSTTAGRSTTGSPRPVSRQSDNSPISGRSAFGTSSTWRYTTHEKALRDEAASVSRLGMEYIHIPVDFQHPTERDFQQFCAVMERLNGVPVHVHCIANYRVSALFYRYRRDVLGMDAAAARSEMEAIWQPEYVWADFLWR